MVLWSLEVDRKSGRWQGGQPVDKEEREKRRKQ
jgi:hypothetical protein